MKERIALAFPFILAAALPLPGLIMAVLRAVEQKYYDAGLLVASAVLGAVIWALVLT